MAINTSYVISLQTNRVDPVVAGEKSVDSMSSLKQAINNVFITGTAFKFEVELTSGDMQVIDFTSLGVSHLRMVLIKSDYQFGYTLSRKGSATATPWAIARTAFVDYSTEAPISFTDANFIAPNVVSISSPTAIHPTFIPDDPLSVIVVQVIAISA